MKIQEVENRLVAWFDKMLTLYPSLSFRYEYSKEHGTYLVSYDAPANVLSNDNFCNEVIRFENELDMLFGENAPLLTEKDMWFAVSELARERRMLSVIVDIPNMVYTLNLDKRAAYKYDYFTPLAA